MSFRTLPIKSGGNSSSAVIPFRIINGGKINNQQKIRVFRGTVTTSDGTFVPSGFSNGDDPPYIFNVSIPKGVVYISVSCNETTGEILSVDNPSSAEEIPDNTSTQFYLELGSFSTKESGGNSIFYVQSNEVGSQMFELCGGINPLWGRV